MFTPLLKYLFSVFIGKLNLFAKKCILWCSNSVIGKRAKLNLAYPEVFSKNASILSCVAALKKFLHSETVNVFVLVVACHVSTSWLMVLLEPYCLTYFAACPVFSSASVGYREIRPPFKNGVHSIRKRAREKIAKSRTILPTLKT